MRWKFILGLLTTCAVLMSMSYTMLIPFLPMYLIQDLGVVKADVDMWSGAIFAITFLVSGLLRLNLLPRNNDFSLLAHMKKHPSVRDLRVFY